MATYLLTRQRRVCRSLFQEREERQNGEFEWQINDTEALVFSLRDNLLQCILYYPRIIENFCRVAYNDTRYKSLLDRLLLRKCRYQTIKTKSDDNQKKGKRGDHSWKKIAKFSLLII